MLWLQFFHRVIVQIDLETEKGPVIKIPKCLLKYIEMGGTLSHFFQSGSALLSAGNHRGCSEQTRTRIRTVFDALRANPKVTAHRLEGLLSQIPKVVMIHN